LGHPIPTTKEHHVKSIKQQQMPTNSDTQSPDTTAGGAPDKVWKISGRLLVRETETDGDVHDRPLKGIEVKVSASDISGDGPWTRWGIATTDADGDFELNQKNNGADRFIRVEARLVADDLEVNDSKLDDLTSLDLLDENWRTVWRSNGQVTGPDVDTGFRIFGGSTSFDLGDETYRRQALIWYVLRTTLDRFGREDPWFVLKGKYAAIYPAHTLGGTSYTNGITRMSYLDVGGDGIDWQPDTVLHEFMHMWNYDHNTGTINWFGAVCSLRGHHPVDLSTHGFQENRNVAFAEGFSEWAQNALLAELWGKRLNRPYNRRTLAVDPDPDPEHRLYRDPSLVLTTLEMVQRSDKGVDSVLRLLHTVDPNGWWGALFGTRDTYPDHRLYENEVGVKPSLADRAVPPGKDHLSVWEVMRAFRASPGTKWDSDLQVGNVDYGIMRFVDRVVDIYMLGEETRVMLERCADPLATDEPYEALEIKTRSASGTPITSVPSGTITAASAGSASHGA
jgi:hypothetical protein